MRVYMLCLIGQNAAEHFWVRVRAAGQAVLLVSTRGVSSFDLAIASAPARLYQLKGTGFGVLRDGTKYP